MNSRSTSLKLGGLAVVLWFVATTDMATAAQTPSTPAAIAEEIRAAAKRNPQEAYDLQFTLLMGKTIVSMHEPAAPKIDGRPLNAQWVRDMSVLETQARYRAMKDHKILIDHVSANGNNVAVQGTWLGTLPDGSKLDYGWKFVFEGIHNGKASTLRIIAKDPALVSRYYVDTLKAGNFSAPPMPPIEE